MKNRTFLQSVSNALNGILYAVKNERNMKIHVAVAVLVLLASWFLKISKTELLIICLTIAGVLICELFNTAVEAFVDIVVNVYHPKARIVKDVAAGAVWVSAVAAVVVGYIVFFDRVMVLVRRLFSV